MAGLQFIGVDPVVKAFENSGRDVWGVCSGKAVNCVGESAEELRAYLEMLLPAGSNNLYTLKVYNIAADDVNEKTVACSSFNFKLVDAQPMRGMAGAPMQVSNPLTGSLEGVIMAKLREKYVGKIEAKLAKILDDDDDDDEPDDIISKITGFLEDPQKLQSFIQVAGVVKNMFSGNRQAGAPYPAAVPVMAPAMVSGVKNNAMSPDEKIQRLSVVLENLERKDPRILEHLEMLDRLATNKPDVFKFLIGQLEGQ